MTPRRLLGTPLGWFPLATSTAALALVLWAVATIDRRGSAAADEGTPAHLWQLLIGLTVLGIAAFGLVWIPRVGARGLLVLGLQVAAAIIAMAPVFLLRL
jgi:peptidoglycan/LPS O-acetylase OafA/YrhL